MPSTVNNSLFEDSDESDESVCDTDKNTRDGLPSSVGLGIKVSRVLRRKITSFHVFQNYFSLGNLSKSIFMKMKLGGGDIYIYIEISGSTLMSILCL